MNSSPQETETSPHDDKQTEQPKLSFLHVLLSVFAAAFGVQNKKNLNTDFNAKGSIYVYIVAGVIFTALFVLSVFMVVQTVLSSAAS